MKKSLLAVSLLAALTTNAIAQDENESWFAGFGELYKVDNNKTINGTGYDVSSGLGIEYGFRFKPEWAARFELSKLNLENDAVSSESGHRFGVDAVKFFNDNAFYGFGGLKMIDMRDSDLSFGYGIGKHFDYSDRFKVILELARYHDIRNSHNDSSLKLGVAYTFGGTSKPKAPTDSDQDGVYDSVDQCPNTAFGVRVDATGCNIDLDNDGVYNADDKCPNTPEGVRVDAMGCNWDKDGDGVANEIDKCPNTPKGTVVGAKGCSLEIDSDQDGVLDVNDQCADTPLTDKVDATGCSIFEEVEVRQTLNVTFGNNSSVIENPNDPKFQEFADFMSRFPNTSTAIEGHASAPGDANYNMMISLKRAQAVRTLLIEKYGVDADRLSAEGFGETQLIDESNTAAAHKVNRRIEARVTATKKEKVLKD